MKPIKLADFVNRKDSKTDHAKVIDLRDYGLTHSAPQEDGHTILTLRIDPESGTLLPAT
jgi:hypothetical protein